MYVMKTKKMYSLVLKLGIVFFAFFFLYKQLITQISSNQFNNLNLSIPIKNNIFLFIIVVFMMFLNWFLEAYKWKFLINKIEKISFLTSIRAVFSGITVSAFTPNRIGEYGGRVFCLDKADRVKAVLITVIGSFSQLIITLSFGFLGLIFLPNFLSELQNSILKINYGNYILSTILICLVFLSIILFIKTPLLTTILNKFRFLKRYRKYNSVFSFYNSKELLFILFLSVLRYLVFTLQFYLLLNLFNINLNYFSFMTLSSVMLLIISIVPSIVITEIGIRASVSLFLFSLISNNSIGILSATFLLWIINLLTPALIGIIFIFSLKFFRK